MRARALGRHVLGTPGVQYVWNLKCVKGDKNIKITSDDLVRL